jgi:Zn-dependent metalloprotease
MNSSVNCVVVSARRPGDPPRQWRNAFWNGTQMVYGQTVQGNGTLLSMSIDLDVVGHEMFHGVTDSTSKLAYMFQSGALNESYSDIFGTIIANFSNPNILSWTWEIGSGLGAGGAAIRDMSNPKRFGQPEKMADFRILPNTRNGDSGGVHINSGIHNKAAFNVMTSVDASGQTLFTPEQIAGIFYLALTQQLSMTSQFIDSRRAVIISAQSLLRDLSPAELDARVDAIGAAYDAVGIK